MDYCNIFLILIWLLFMYFCKRFNEDNPERYLTGISLILLLGCIFIAVLFCIKNIAFINKYTVDFLLPLIPACMFFILKTTVREDIKPCYISLSFIFFLTISIAIAIFSNDEVLSKAFYSLTISNGIWLLERLVKVCVQRFLKKHPIH